MKVVVFGAGGKTGQLVVDRAVAAGHEVTAFVHDADQFRQSGATERVTVAVGDATVAAAVSAAVAGQDAVVDAIGGKTPYKETDVERKAAETMLNAMKRHGVRRLIAISMLCVGDSTDQAPFWVTYLMQPSYLRGATKDKEAMEQEVRASDVDFVLVRPSILNDDPATGSVKVFEGHEKAHKITRADLAQFVVEQLSSDAHLKRAVTVGNS